MLTPQFVLPLHHELVIDLFAGLADEARRERITTLLGEIIAGVHQRKIAQRKQLQ